MAMSLLHHNPWKLKLPEAPTNIESIQQRENAHIQTKITYQMYITLKVLSNSYKQYKQNGTAYNFRALTASSADYSPNLTIGLAWNRALPINVDGDMIIN